jgi:hypothetical protein
VSSACIWTGSQERTRRSTSCSRQRQRRVCSSGAAFVAHGTYDDWDVLVFLGFVHCRFGYDCVKFSLIRTRTTWNISSWCCCALVRTAHCGLLKAADELARHMDNMPRSGWWRTARCQTQVEMNNTSNKKIMKKKELLKYPNFKLHIQFSNSTSFFHMYYSDLRSVNKWTISWFIQTSVKHTHTQKKDLCRNAFIQQEMESIKFIPGIY